MSWRATAMVAGCLTGCQPPPSVAPLSPTEYHYRGRMRSSRAATATALYRVVATTLGSRCAMWPNDSRYFDDVVERCPAHIGLVRSLARLFVEPAASPRFLRPVRIDQDLRWVDRSEEVRCR